MKKLLKYILLLIYVALMPACGEDSGLDGVFANKPFAHSCFGFIQYPQKRPLFLAVTHSFGDFKVASCGKTDFHKPRIGVEIYTFYVIEVISLSVI